MMAPSASGPAQLGTGKRSNSLGGALKRKSSPKPSLVVHLRSAGLILHLSTSLVGTRATMSRAQSRPLPLD